MFIYFKVTTEFLNWKFPATLLQFFSSGYWYIFGSPVVPNPYIKNLFTESVREGDNPLWGFEVFYTSLLLNVFLMMCQRCVTKRSQSKYKLGKIWNVKLCCQFWYFELGCWGPVTKCCEQQHHFQMTTHPFLAMSIMMVLNFLPSKKITRWPDISPKKTSLSFNQWHVSCAKRWLDWNQRLCHTGVLVECKLKQYCSPRV